MVVRFSALTAIDAVTHWASPQAAHLIPTFSPLELQHGQRGMVGYNIQFF